MVIYSEWYRRFAHAEMRLHQYKSETGGLSESEKALEEKMVLEKSDPNIKFRYVDDVWLVWPHGEDRIKVFLDYHNNQLPNILEIEENKNAHPWYGNYQETIRNNRTLRVQNTHTY